MSLSYIYRFIPVISSTSESTPNLAHIPTCGNPATQSLRPHLLQEAFLP